MFPPAPCLLYGSYKCPVVCFVFVVQTVVIIEQHAAECFCPSEEYDPPAPGCFFSFDVIDDGSFREVRVCHMLSPFSGRLRYEERCMPNGAKLTNTISNSARNFTHIGTVFVSVIPETEGRYICCNHFQAYYRRLLNCLPSCYVQYDAPFRLSSGVSPLFTSQVNQRR